MNELPSFAWDRRACSLESFIDDRRSTLPGVVQTAEGFCPELEEDTLENGQTLILHEIRQQQFAVVTHPNGAELYIPVTCPVKVELVPLDRLNEEYNIVEELFMAQPDYFRVLDDIPSLDIKSGSVMKICSRQNGVYHLECEVVNHVAHCQEIVKLPLTQHGRFRPLHDAGEYLLEEVLARYPPPSEIGVRFVNSSSTGSRPFTSDTHLPWGSGLRLQKVLDEETVIATTAEDELKEVLLFPKTLDVSVVPALDCSEQLVTMARTSAFDHLVEQAMKFNSLRAYHGSSRLRKFDTEDLMTPSSEPCERISPNIHEPLDAQTMIRNKTEQDSIDSSPTKGQPKQTRREAFQSLMPITKSVSLQRFSYSKAQLQEKRRGRVGLESLLKDCVLELSDDDYRSVFSNTSPSLYCEEDPKKPTKAKINVHSKSETQSELFVSRSFSESDLDNNTGSRSFGMEETVKELSESEFQSDSDVISTSLRHGLSLRVSSDEDEDIYSKISDNSLVRGLSLDGEDGYSTISRRGMSRGTSPDEDDGYSRISENGLARDLSSEEEDYNGYSTISLDANESEYTEIEDCNDGTREQLSADEIEETHLEINIPETGQWSCGTGAPKGVGGRPASYWFAYQHLGRFQAYLSGCNSAPYVNRPLLHPRRRQHSDGVADTMKKSINSEESNHREDGASGQDQESVVRKIIHKKSRSESDVFRCGFSTMEVRDLDDENYIDFLADNEPDAAYLELVDVFPDSLGPNCQRATFGTEEQESHERRISGDSSQEEGSDGSDTLSYSYPYMYMGGFEDGILTTMSDRVSMHTDDPEDDTERSKPLPCWTVHTDDQNQGCPTADKITFSIDENKEECSPCDSAVASCTPPVPPRKPGKRLSRASNGDSELVEGPILGSIPPYQKPRQNRNDLYENNRYPLVTEVRKEHGSYTEDGGNEDCEDLNSVAVHTVQIVEASQELKEVLRHKKMTKEKQKDDGKTTVGDANDKEARRFQESQRLPGKKNVSLETPNGKLSKSQTKNGKETAANITKNHGTKTTNKESKKPIPQRVPEDEHKRDCEHEFEDFEDIQLSSNKKEKKTLVNVTFEAELSRVIGIKPQHASRAHETLAISQFGSEFSPPSLSTETSSSLDEQSEKHTRNTRSCQKSKKAPVPIPRAKGKSPT